jgi:hypothetical protein
MPSVARIRVPVTAISSMLDGAACCAPALLPSSKAAVTDQASVLTLNGERERCLMNISPFLLMVVTRVKA